VAIGERLREARMRRKIDIADVESATKIRAKYLRALENEEFGLLPGNTFVKTFLRTYAEYLGLDPQLLLEEYRAGYEPRNETELQPYSVAAQQPRREPRRAPRPPTGPPGPGTALLVIAAVVLVIFAILGLTSGEGDDQPQNEADRSQQREQTTPEEPAPEEEEEPQVTTVRLRIRPAVATYLCVDRGPETEIVYQGTTADPVGFRGKRLRVNSGNSSIRVTANGERVEIPEGSVPVGYEFRLRRGDVVTDEVPLGERPCA
jgi:cytoskeleton protein RodZ